MQDPNSTENNSHHSRYEDKWTTRAFDKTESRTYRFLFGTAMTLKNSLFIGVGIPTTLAYLAHRGYHATKKGHSKDVRHGMVRIAYAGRTCWPQYSEEILRNTFEKNFAHDTQMRDCYQILMGTRVRVDRRDSNDPLYNKNHADLYQRVASDNALRQKCGYEEDAPFFDIQNIKGKDAWVLLPKGGPLMKEHPTSIEDVDLKLEDKYRMIAEESRTNMKLRLTCQHIIGKQSTFLEFPETASADKTSKRASLQIRLFTNESLMHHAKDHIYGKTGSNRMLTDQEKSDWKAAFLMATEVKKNSGAAPPEKWLQENGISAQWAFRRSGGDKRQVEEDRGTPFIGNRYCVSSGPQKNSVTVQYETKTHQSPQNNQHGKTFSPDENKSSITLNHGEQLRVKISSSEFTHKRHDCLPDRFHVEMQKVDINGQPHKPIYGMVENDNPLINGMLVAFAYPLVAQRQNLTFVFTPGKNGTLLANDIQCPPNISKTNARSVRQGEVPSR